LIRDRDGAYGAAFIRRIRTMGMRDRPVSARSPSQNGYAERLIGSIRQERLDHVVVVGERHLRHVLASYQKYYNNAFIAKLNSAAVTALADPAVGALLTDLGFEIYSRDQQTPEALDAYQKAEIKKWWPIIKEFGIKAE
jgi:hypothetical protein